MNSVDQDQRSFKIASGFLCVLTALSAGYAIWVLLTSQLFPQSISYLFAGILGVAAILLICMQLFLTSSTSKRIWITLLNALVMISLVCGGLYVQSKTSSLPAGSDQSSEQSSSQASSTPSSTSSAASSQSAVQPSENIPASPEAQPDPNAASEPAIAPDPNAVPQDPAQTDPAMTEDQNIQGV